MLHLQYIDIDETKFNQTNGKLKDLINMIKSMLRLLPLNRSSMNDIYDTKYVQDRKLDKTEDNIRDTPMIIKNHDMRKRMGKIILKLYNKNEFLSSSPKSLFHAVNLYDRYLLSIEDDFDSLTKKDNKFIVYCCIYIAIKYLILVLFCYH